MKSPYWHMAAVGVITLVAFWLRFHDLGKVNLYHDEYYQFETAVGYVKTGEFARYDFYVQQLGKPYTRAWPFIVQIVSSLNVFGVSEMAARLPAVLWGTLLIPVVIGLLWWITKQPLIAYATGTVLTFDYFMIGLARYVRMYTMLIACCTVIAALIYNGAEKKSRYRLLQLAGAVIATIISLSIFKELTLALLGAIGIYVLIRAGAFVWKRNHADRWWAGLCLFGLGVVGAGWIAQYSGYPIYPTTAIIIREQPHWSYLEVLYLNWRVPIVAYIFFVIGIVSQWKQRRSVVMYAATLSVIALSYFVFFSHRWDAHRYVSFFAPLLTLVTVVGWLTVARFLWAVLPPQRWVRIPLVAAFLVFAGPWLSFPGFPGQNLIFEKAIADQSGPELGYPDLQTAYQYVLDHYQAGEVVLIQTPRFYYWTDPTIPVHKLGGYQSLSFEEFKALAAQGESGGWMIYDYTHGRHLQDKIKQYATHRFFNIKELNDGLVHVYHFTPDDLEPRRK